MGKERDGIFLGGVGSDIFGEEGTARVVPYDRANDSQRTKLLLDYLIYHKRNSKFYEGFENDLSYMYRLSWQSWGWAAVGVVFAGVIFNPNYTSRHSFYLRKLTPVFFGTIGY